jgi:hypothetical protein
VHSAGNPANRMSSVCSSNNGKKITATNSRLHRIYHEGKNVKKQKTCCIDSNPAPYFRVRWVQAVAAVAQS